jgi:hypothetical protein
VSDPKPAPEAGEEMLVKLYLELTGSSELCARSVVHYLESPPNREKPMPEEGVSGSESTK